MPKSARMKAVTVVAIGECSVDSGGGGIGVVLTYLQHRKELSAAFAMTTAERVALAAAIAGLEALRESCVVQLYTNSPAAVGVGVVGELSERMRALCMQHHTVTARQLVTYDSDPEGLRCVELARKARRAGPWLEDAGYLDVLAQKISRQASFAAADALRRDESRRAHDAELALSPHVQTLKKQIRELSGMIATKLQYLGTYTLNDRAHDRLYETLERDQERLEKLMRALAEAEAGR